MAYPTPLPYAGLFSGISAQLDALNTRVQRLEKTTQSAVSQATDVSDDMITCLQSFDYLRQSLEDLTRLTDLLSQNSSGTGVTATAVSDIISQLQMAETKALLGAAPFDKPDPLARDTGEALWF